LYVTCTDTNPVTENTRPRDPAPGRKGRPERDPQLRLQVLGAVAAGGHQRAQPPDVDHHLLPEAEGAPDERAVYGQRVDGEDAGRRAQADQRRPDDVHEPAAVPLPAALARGSC